MSDETVLFDKRDHIATITMNRPEALNTYTNEMLAGIYDALQDARDDDDVRVLILTGAGRAFCAGADLKSGQMSSEIAALDRARWLSETVHRIVLGFRNLGKPSIAAVNGPATGAGMDLALACDIRIASERARFVESYVKVGVNTGAGGAFTLPRIVGVSKALELLLTGDAIDAREAERIGVVSKVVPADQLLPEALALAQRIAANPPLAVKFIRQSVFMGQQSSFDDVLKYIGLTMGNLLQTEDCQEAVRAFGEKRQGDYKGR